MNYIYFINIIKNNLKDQYDFEYKLKNSLSIKKVKQK